MGNSCCSEAQKYVETDGYKSQPGLMVYDSRRAEGGKALVESGFRGEETRLRIDD